MLRGAFRPDGLSGERHFRWRGGDVSRLEGLADAIFALALTLLVVRLEVPRTFAEVRFAFASSPVYVACFALFLWIWHCHYQLHRRYGPEGPLAVALDGALLFCVLLFALPLRFVADLLWTRARFGDAYVLDHAGAVVRDAAGEPLRSVAAGDATVLMVYYAGGFALLFLLLSAQTALAYARREALELDEVERYVTRATMTAHLATAGVGGVAVALALAGLGPAAGMVFFALGPLHGLLGWRRGARAERLARGAGTAP